jgi:hypothetical protein
MKPGARLSSVLPLLMATTLSWPADSLHAGFESQDDSLLNAQGIVQRVDYGSQSVIISGLEYHFAVDARVQIDGGPGAWSMLEVDAAVDFLYREDSNVHRTIVELYTMPGGTPISEH